MSADTSQFDGTAYLRKAREADARYLTDTHDLIVAHTKEDMAAVLTRISGGRVYYAVESAEVLNAAVLGALGYRAQFIIARLNKAEARVAELEAELAEVQRERDILFESSNG